MKLLIAGATGTVGRELTRLAVSEGHDVVAISRNRVLLDALASSLGCEALQSDLLSDASRLPHGEALVDLTWPNRRLPRQVVRAAEGAVAAVDSWLGRNPGSVAVHAGTFVVAGVTNPAPDSLLNRLVWDDPYALAKSAGERAVSRARHRDRISVVRLGNVLTDDSAWGSLILRCLAYGSVANPAALGAAANLCTVRPLLKVLERPTTLTAATAGAGTTWARVITRTADLTGSPFQSDAVADGTLRLPGTSGALSRIAQRALWAAPAILSDIRPWQVWPLLRPARAVQRSVTGHPPAGPAAPPTLPATAAMPGGRDDVGQLEPKLASLADAFYSRGWGQTAPTT